MPRKYQAGRLEKRTDVRRPYYFVRATVVHIDGRSGERRRVRREHKIGFVDELTVKRAKELRADILETVNAGRFLVQSQYRFKDLTRRFFDTRFGQLGIATQNQYRCQINNHLLPAFGEMKLCDIDRSEVERFLTAKAESLGWWARNNLRSILSAVFKAAKDWKLWDGEIPTLGVKIGKQRFVREKRLLGVQDLRRLLAALPDHLKFIVLIQFGLGLRISETLGLRWSDVNFKTGSLAVKRRWYRGDLSDEMKTASSAADMLLSASMLAEFQQRYPGVGSRDAFIFLGDDGLNPPDDRDLLRFQFRPILVALKLYYPGFGWHAFRRQNITWRQQVGGATPLEAQRAARHTSLDMTYLYTLPDRERETAQQQKMFDALLALPEGGPKH